MGDLRDSFVRFFNGEFTKKDFLIVKTFLIRETERLLAVYNLEEEKEEVAFEFIKHLLEKTYHFRELIKTGKFSIAYVKKTLRNFIIDKVRRKIITISLDENDEEHGGSRENKLIKKDPVELERKIELLEFTERFNSLFEEEEVKILCYLYDRSYKCFWKEKTEAALYKHVSRNRSRVVDKLRELARTLQASPEALERFIHIHLSEECEKLRSKYCKEDTENGDSEKTP